MPLERYLTDSYIKDNPDWDLVDSPWKAGMVLKLIEKHELQPENFVEVGCGAGAVIAELSKFFPASKFIGYDISPYAANFWDKYKSEKVSFECGNLTDLNKRHHDILLALDVLEHVADPFEFLKSLLNSADYFIFHIPLDLSAVSVLRESPLLYVRNKVGHIHYFTKGIAISLLQECGYTIVDCLYTDASYSKISSKRIRTYLANLPRYLLNKINRDWSARMLGGQTLMIFAKR